MKKHFEPQNKKHLIAQSRQLVEARYNFTLWEMRLFIEVLEQIKKEDKELRGYRVYYKDLIREYGENKQDYKYIRNASIRLLRKVAHFEYVNEEGQERVYHAVLFTGADTPKNWQEKDENMYIDFSVNGDLKEQLIQLKRNYLLYDKRHILRLKSKFSVRIYQLLKSHEREAKDTVIVEYKIKILREMLLVDEDGNPNNQYSKHFMFKKRVLLQAQKELKEHTDIAFSFEEIKKGKRIDIIRFFVKKNRKNHKKNATKQLDLELQKPPTQAQKPIEKPSIKQQKSIQNPLIQQQKPIQKTAQPKPKIAADPVFHSPARNRAYQKLINIGVATTQARKLVKRHDVPYIITSIEQAQQAHQISPKNNLAGFVINCIKEETYKEIAQKQQAKKAREKIYKEKQKLHRQVMDIKEEYEKKRQNCIDSFRNKLNEETTKKSINNAREIKGVAERTDDGIINSVYFDIGIAGYFSEIGEFPKEYQSFDNYLQKHFIVKVAMNNYSGFYEIIG